MFLQAQVNSTRKKPKHMHGFTLLNCTRKKLLLTLTYTNVLHNFITFKFIWLKQINILSAFKIAEIIKKLPGVVHDPQ